MSSIKLELERATSADVFYAYRLILGRKPDRLGLLSHIERVEQQGVSVDKLRSMFFNSREFSSRGSRLSRVPLGDGPCVFVDPTELDFGKAISQAGRWEPHVVAALLEHIQPGDVFVDVGANVGVMSFQVACAVGPAGKVISFEPNPRNVQALLLGVTENKFNNVQVYPFALSDRSAVFSLMGSSNSFLRPAEQGMTLMQAFVADDILAREERIDFVKLDIEGHEPAALSGMAQTIRRHRPKILCEFNPACLTANSGTAPSVFAAQLFEISRRCTAIEPNGTRHEVADAAALMALWEERNAAAVRAGHLADGRLHLDVLLLATGDS